MKMRAAWMVVCVVAVVGAVAADAAAQEPWQGAPGITETVSHIMGREVPRLAGKPLQLGNPRRQRDREPNLPQHPGAPEVASWPPGGGVAISETPSLPQAVGTNFLGAQLSESGFIPPDSMGAIGPDQILVAANGRIKVFDRSGVLGPLNADTDNFFLSVRNGSSTSDPRVVYDRLSSRWFVSMITVDPPNRVLLAVSSGPTITGSGSFTFFQFQQDLVGATPNSDSGGLADYDSLGVDANAAYIGVNVFNGAGTAFLGTTGFVIRKSSVLAGGPIVVTAFRQMGTGAVTGPFAPVGVNNDDPLATNGYFVGVDTLSFGLLVLRRISNPGGAPSISGNLFVPVPATQFPRSVPALGSTANLDALDDRLFSASIKAGSLWTAHNINVTSGGVATTATGTSGRDGSRFYEIANLGGAPTLAQSGTLFDNTVVASGTARHHWIPSIAASGQGHVAMGVSVAAPTNSAGTQLQPAVAVAGRLVTDPLGTIQAPTIAKPGGGNYNVQPLTPQRWGDFSSTRVDPTDDMTFWTFQEYANANNSWGVQVVQLKAPPPATPSLASPGAAAAGATNVNVALTGTAVSGSGFFDPGPDFPKHISASVNGGGVTVNSVTFNSPTSVTLNLNVAANAAAGSRTITVTNPDGQAVTSATGIFSVQSVAPPTITQHINGQHPNPAVVNTTGPMLLTVDVSPSNFNTPVSWFWAIVVNGGAPIWVTSTGTSATPMPFAVAPPPAGGITNLQLLNLNLPPATSVTSFFAIVDGTNTVIASDIITGIRQ